MSKTVLITGASRGIGAALAVAFAKDGYQLSLCAKNSYQELVSHANTIKENTNTKILCFCGDVSDENFIQTMVTRTEQELGPIDILINNAGISHIGLLSDMNTDTWNQVMGTNLNSVFFTSRAVIPSMISRKQGCIINISSVWGEVGASCEVAYSASKGAVNAFTKALAKELAPSNITVNAISCGVIDTQMNACFSEEEHQTLIDEIPSNRMGDASEVAALALQIASSPTYMTGQILRIDGGWI